jgi:transmembrane sensor
MTKDPYQIAKLIEAYLSKKLSSEEEAHFMQLLADDAHLQELLNVYQNKRALNARLSYIDTLNLEAAYQKVALKLKVKRKKRHQLFSYLKYAAVLTIVGVSVFCINKIAIVEKSRDKIIQIAPFNGKEIELQLSDGKKIQLQHTKISVKEQDGTILTSNERVLSYQPPRKKNGAAISYNSLNVPPSNIYCLQLSDGTKVWLNSATQITYPVSFTTKERLVSVKGEAYFEVAKNALKPFKVQVNGTEIMVLGTKFNVSAYNKLTYTTLVEGSVSIKNKAYKGLLKPGQLAVAGAGNIQIKKADIEKALAWKNGEFNFNNDDIHEIMDQLARWYDLKIRYGNNLPTLHYSGSISRSDKIDKVLLLLTDITGLKFSLNGKILKVENK